MSVPTQPAKKDVPDIVEDKLPLRILEITAVLAFLTMVIWFIGDLVGATSG